MGEIITKHEAYAAWDYEKEIEQLNIRSAEGLQLVQGGCFRSKYEKDSSVQYRYQIDFNRHIDNKMRYIESFKEQGWEFISSTFNGWHYFRKPFDPALGEEEYEIYTDRPSMSELAGRWLKFMLPMLVLVTVFFLYAAYEMIRFPELSRIGILIEMGAFLFLLSVGLVKTLQLKKGIRSARKFPFPVIFLLALAGYLSFTGIAFTKGNVQTNMKTSYISKEGVELAQFSAPIPDYYYLTLKSKTKDDTLITIQNTSTGKAVFQMESKDLSLDKEKLFLGRGKYQIVMTDQTQSDGSDTAVSVNLDIN